ncbi:MAG TPA: DUF4838 domain-containing protein [Tepidisphaeraceae bacterium]|jgi:hypothetical protein
MIKQMLAVGLFFGVTVSSLWADEASSGLMLVNGGQSDYVIVVNSSPMASYADLRGARTLQTYIAQMSGATLPILQPNDAVPAHAIIVGMNSNSEKLGVHPDMKQLGDDGFVMKSVGSDLVVAGPGKRGSMYACFDLLDKLGVRWFTSKVTSVPHLATISLPAMDETQIPSFEYREPYFTEALEPDWAAHNRLNSDHAPLNEAFGGRLKYYGGPTYFVHTLDELVPHEAMIGHPEYLPMVNGKRVDGYVQRCLSNPDVLKMTIAKVEQWIADDPDAKIFSVSQNDTDHWCTCPDCMAIQQKYGGVTGEYIWFVNQVAAAIAKDHPDVIIDTLAYQFTEPPPKNIHPLPNVRVRLCPIACENAHPYDQSNYGANVALMQRLHEWHTLTDNLYVWHYSISFGHYLMPYPDFASFPATLKIYKNNGVKGVFLEGDYADGGGGSDAELRSYVLSRLLWNVDDNAEARIDEWMQGVYGPAAKPMRAWHDLIQKQYAPANQYLPCYEGPRPEIYTPAVMEQGKQFFAQAEQLAQTPIQREYIEKNRLGWRYVDLILHPDTGEKLDQFIADCKSFGITQLNEGRPIDQWVVDYQKAHPAK